MLSQLSIPFHDGTCRSAIIYLTEVAISAKLEDAVTGLELPHTQCSHRFSTRQFSRNPILPSGTREIHFGVGLACAWPLLVLGLE